MGLRADPLSTSSLVEVRVAGLIAGNAVVYLQLVPLMSSSGPIVVPSDEDAFENETRNCLPPELRVWWGLN